jgi:hypothetical protein
VTCEYDGQVLPTDPVTGLPDACPECERDIQAHFSECLTCRLAPNLPDFIDPKAILEALA